MAARLQGRDEIITARPSERVRPLTADSTLLPRWGPPVSAVELAGLVGSNGSDEGAMSGCAGGREVKTSAPRSSRLWLRRT